MKSLMTVILIVVSISLPGCSRQGSLETANRVSSANDPAAPAEKYRAEAELRKTSLGDVDQSQAAAEAMDRKIISSADLSLEVATPTETQQQIGSIAATLGGFVVTSESKQTESNNPDPSKQQLTVTLVVRVPAAQFNSAITQIRATAGRIIHQKISGEDVTEEFIDLEARLKTQKALELQFIEIMKQATKIIDAMEVQRQIAEVRDGIEKLEGRKRFLANHASLSTITISLNSPTAIIVNTSSFGRSVRDAVAGSLDLSTEIVLGAIRLIILLMPLVIFIGLPAALVARYFVRRAKRLNVASGLESPH